MDHLGVDAEAEEEIEARVDGLVDRLFAGPISGRQAEPVRGYAGVAKRGAGKILIHVLS